MNKVLNRISSLAITMAIVVGIFPTMSFAENDLGKVYVSFENTTSYNQSSGAKWDGTLLNMAEVAIDDGDTMLDIFNKVVEKNGITQTGAEYSYITEINGLSAGDGGAQSGWVTTINDWFATSGINDVYVSDGDVLKWMYSLDYGADMGGDWSNAAQTLSNLTFSEGEMDTSFTENDFEYTLTIPNDVTTVQVTPTASNKNYQTRIYKNAVVLGDSETGYSIDGESEYENMLSGLAPWTSLPNTLDFYKRTDAVPVKNGDKIIVGCALPNWATMNTKGNGSIYTINVVKENVEECNITVKVAPSTIDVNFYECDGFDKDNYDILGEEVSAVDNGVVDNYHVYTMTVPQGTYSFRGTNVGGMTFDVADESEMEIVLRQTDVYTTTKYDGENYPTENEYTTKIVDSDGMTATAGTPYIDTYTKFPYLLLANGNAEQYTMQLIPSQIISEEYSLGVGTSVNKTVAQGTSILKFTGTLPTLIDTVINAPSDSTVKVFNQIRNYCNEEVSPQSVTDGENGTKDYTYRLPKSNGSHTYRVSKTGKITKAGYLNLSSSEKAATTVTFADDENPTIRPEYDTETSIGKMAEDSMLLNINEQNYLRLNTDDTFKVRPYRAWQIVNNTSSNVMIEPDFHYNVLSGEDNIEITQVGKDAVVKGVKSGISIVEVTYDAIEIGGNTNFGGVYGAVDPYRKGLFIVNVDGDTNTEITMPTWDSEIDTVYFTGDSGEYNFKPTSNSAMTVICNETVIAPNDDDSYTLPINQGNNIVSVTAGETTEYLTIKGNKITVNIENLTNPNSEIKQGDEVGISLKGLHMPVPKFSGIYNPGYGATMKTSYKTPSGSVVQSKGTQYDFINNNTITFTVYEEGTLNLVDGYIPMSSMGGEIGTHRDITDTGVGANFNASNVVSKYSQLPDVNINVAKNNDLSYLAKAKSDFATLTKVNILCGTDSFSKSFSITKTGKNEKATFTSINSEYPFVVTAVPKNYDVSMEFRYWEDGDTEKTVVKMNPGESLDLGKGLFSGEKTINMEIAVTPSNPIFGTGEVYSYTVYPKSSTSESILSSIEIKDSENIDFDAPYGILRSENGKGISYSQSDYYCYVPEDCDTITVNLAKLVGEENITVGEEIKSVGTTAVDFTNVKLDNETNQVLIQLANGKTYTIEVIKSNGINEVSTVNDDDIIAVSVNSSIDTTLNVFVASYDDDNTLVDLKKYEENIQKDENNIFIDYSDMEGNIAVFVWDNNLVPYQAKTPIQ